MQEETTRFNRLEKNQNCYQYHSQMLCKQKIIFILVTALWAAIDNPTLQTRTTKRILHILYTMMIRMISGAVQSRNDRVYMYIPRLFGTEAMWKCDIVKGAFEQTTPCYVLSNDSSRVNCIRNLSQLAAFTYLFLIKWEFFSIISICFNKLNQCTWNLHIMFS